MEIPVEAWKPSIGVIHAASLGPTELSLAQDTLPPPCPCTVFLPLMAYALSWLTFHLAVEQSEPLKYGAPGAEGVRHVQ